MKRRRRFFMALPILVLPFLTIIFWAFGGGRGKEVHAQNLHGGLNTELPDPHFTGEEPSNKLQLYEIAEREMNKFEEARESDPYFDLITFQEQKPVEVDDSVKESKLIDSFPGRDQFTVDPNEEKVNRKLQELYSQLNTSPGLKSKEVKQNNSPVEETSPDMERLEKMMELMLSEGKDDTQGAEHDPEMQQIEAMLDKILDVQHPERVREKLKQKKESDKGKSYGVSPVEDAVITEFEKTEEAETTILQNGFYGLDDETTSSQTQDNAMEALIHDTQELVTGATVKIRLLKDVRIHDVVVKKDQFIYGVCTINGERLSIEIASVRSGNALLPVSLSVFDLDGLEGIYIPGAIARDVAKQATDDALQNIQLMSMDPSLEAQAASAGVEAAKGLFSKKVKLIKVTVKAGYHVFLKDKNSE